MTSLTYIENSAAAQTGYQGESVANILLNTWTAMWDSVRAAQSGSVSDSGRAVDTALIETANDLMEIQVAVSRRPGPNEDAIRLLTGWLAEDASDDSSSWTDVKAALDEHRTSHRKLFGE